MISDFGTPIYYEPDCPCGAPIVLRGPAGAKCKAGHLARLSIGPVAYLEWPVPGAWRYERPPRPESVWEAAVDAHRHCVCGAGIHRGRTLDGREHVCQAPKHAARRVALL